MPLTNTVPLTVALPDVAVKFAVFDVPLVESHGVPVTPVQLVAVVFHVPLVALHVPSAADASGRQKAREAHQKRMREVRLARKCPGEFMQRWGFMSLIFACLISDSTKI
jgi:hypothetical protein